MKYTRDTPGWIARHWLQLIVVAWGLFVWGPWLAPVFAHFGWKLGADIVYRFYSATCHQLPQRSFFLFGQQFTYELDTIQQVFQNTDNPLILRQFIGNAQMGWKVAWSDRMVSFYGGIWLWLTVWLLIPARRRPRFSLAVLILLGLPLMLDGTSHMVSDILFGIGNGFRDHNSWLATLTDNRWPGTFYAGDSLGTFNSWMRLVSGLLCSLGLVGWVVPRIDHQMIFSKLEPASPL